jgi:hypothetical protein
MTVCCTMAEQPDYVQFWQEGLEDRFTGWDLLRRMKKSNNNNNEEDDKDQNVHAKKKKKKRKHY